MIILSQPKMPQIGEAMDVLASPSLRKSPEKTDGVRNLVQTNFLAFGKGTQLGIHKLDNAHNGWLSAGFLPNRRSSEKTLVGFFGASLRLLTGDRYC